MVVRKTENIVVSDFFIGERMVRPAGLFKSASEYWDIRDAQKISHGLSSCVWEAKTDADCIAVMERLDVARMQDLSAKEPKV